MNFLIENKTTEIKFKAIELAPQGKPDFDKIFEKGQTASLRVVEKHVKPVLLAGIISSMIDSVNEYFNVVRPMTSAQIQELSIDFMQLKDHRLEDFLAFFEGCKKGRFGKVFDRLDQSIIWQMWDQYEAERENYFYSDHKKAQDNNIESNVRSNPTAAIEIQNKISKLGSGFTNMANKLKGNKDG